MIIDNVKLLRRPVENQEILSEKIMFNKLLITLITIFIIFFAYRWFIFDINNYKANLEQLISEKANVEFRISGKLSLDLGINPTLNAEKLSIRKNNLLVLSPKHFIPMFHYLKFYKGGLILIRSIIKIQVLWTKHR